MDTTLSELFLTTKNDIGGIAIQATLEEVNTDTLQITEHPVEQGAAITDHSYVRPSEVVIKCGWSNSSLSALTNLEPVSNIDGGKVTKSDYISNIYSQLIALQQSRKPFSITTSKRQYDNMLIAGLQVTTDNKTNSVLMVAATCRQIIIVETQAITLPPSSSQANPESTASTANNGVKQLIAANPSPGGSVLPGQM